MTLVLALFTLGSLGIRFFWRYYREKGDDHFTLYPYNMFLHTCVWWLMLVVFCLLGQWLIPMADVPKVQGWQRCLEWCQKNPGWLVIVGSCTAWIIDGCRENHLTNYGFPYYSDNLCYRLLNVIELVIITTRRETQQRTCIRWDGVIWNGSNDCPYGYHTWCSFVLMHKWWCFARIDGWRLSDRVEEEQITE